jgi:integrase
MARLPGSVFVENRKSSVMLRVKHPRLSKPFYAAMDDGLKAREYGGFLLEELRAGRVPEVLAELAGVDPATIAPGNIVIDGSASAVKMILAYLNGAVVAPTDAPVLRLLADMDIIKSATVNDVLSVKWVDRFVADLKIKQHLAPSTVRKRVESLARAVEWHLRRVTPDGETPPPNPLRNLPRNYSAASADDAEALRRAGKKVKKDEPRKRRLLAVEDDRIQAALRGECLPGQKEALSYDPELELAYLIISEHGLRLFEVYRMEVEDVLLHETLPRGTFKVRGAKGHYGKILWRDVPIKESIIDRLRKLVERRKEQGAVRLFSWWDGEEKSRPNLSAALSKRFKDLFDYCGVLDCSEHDLRHEATCRWVTMRNSRGDWALSDTALCKIMGWHGASAHEMLLRYASLRGEDLSNLIAA